MLINSSVPNLANGVSQQPASLRLASQAEEQINALSTVSHGNIKRQGTTHIRNIQPWYDGASHLLPWLTASHLIELTNGTKVMLVCFRVNGPYIGSHLRAYLVPSGVEVPVENLSGVTPPWQPARDLKFLTVQDTTFLLDRSKTVTAESATNETRPFESLIVIRGGNYGKTYTISIDGVSRASYQTPDGSTAAHSAQIDTTHIATQLVAQLAPLVGVTTPVTWTTHSHVSSTQTWQFNGGTPFQTTVYEGIRVTLQAGVDPSKVQATVYGVPARIVNNGDGTVTIPHGRALIPVVAPHLEISLLPAAGSSDFTILRDGNVILLRRTTPFTVTVVDGQGGANMAAYSQKVQRFSDLPKRCFDGVTLKVTGNAAEEEDDYYVRYTGSVDEGTWEEVAAPGSIRGLNNATMPLEVTPVWSGGTLNKLRVQRGSWDIRSAGDDTSNPMPSFVGTQINDIFFYRNRLGFLTDSAAVLSADGAFRNFFRDTVTTITDADVIDIEVTSEKSGVLRKAVTVADSLLLIADQAQYTDETEGLFTSKTASFKVATVYEVSGNYEAASMGRYAYFMTENGRYTSCREFFKDGNSGVRDAADITAHCPTYINTGNYSESSEPDCGKIVPVPAENMLLVIPAASYRSQIFVYRYYWSGDEKLQSSWSKWDFDGSDSTWQSAPYTEKVGVVSAVADRSILYMVMYRAGGLTLESLDTTVGAHIPDEARPAGLQVAPTLDAKVTLSLLGVGVYNPLTFSSRFPMPSNMVPSNGPQTVRYFAYVVGTTFGQVQAPGVKNGEFREIVMDYDAGLGQWFGTINGNFSGCQMTIGRAYDFRYEPSTFYLRATDGGVSKAELGGRLQVRRASLNHSDTGAYYVTVKQVGRDDRIYTFSGKVLSSASATLGAASYSTGRFSVPVMGRNEEVRLIVHSDLPVPVGLLTLDWEAFYSARSRTV